MFLCDCGSLIHVALIFVRLQIIAIRTVTASTATAAFTVFFSLRVAFDAVFRRVLTTGLCLRRVYVDDARVLQNDDAALN